MELRKKVHLKLKNIDIKFKLTKYVIGIAILLLSACDFRLPQKWETPSWELPLSIPLYNGSITMFDLIDTTGSDLTLDTLGNYSIDTSLVMIYQPCPELMKIILTLVIFAALNHFQDIIHLMKIAQ